jgi:hypothetical protein
VYVVLTGDFSFSLASDDAHGHKQRLVWPRRWQTKSATLAALATQKCDSL